MALSVKEALERAGELARRGRFQEATALFRQIAAASAPGSVPGLQAETALAALTPASDPVAELRQLFRQGQHAALIEAAERLRPEQVRAPTVQILVGAAEMALKRPDRAEGAFRKVVEVTPDRPAAQNNLGLALHAQGKLAEARAAFRRALTLRPDYGDAQNGLGLVLSDEGDLDGAAAAFEAAARLKPGDPDIWTNLGNMRLQKGRIEAAIEAYRTALSRTPGHANAHYNFGLALKAAGRLPEAVKQYRAAIKAQPGLAIAHNNLGNALHAMGQNSAAESALHRAVELAPGDAELQRNLAYFLQSMGRFDEAVARFETALLLDPGNARSEAARLFLMAQMCDWRAHAEFAAKAERLGVDGAAVFPFDLLSFEDAPERQLRRAERYASDSFAADAPSPPPPPAAPRGPTRLRIGYFSADFRSHPVARLIAGTLAAHDRERFELYAYSFGPDRQDPFRKALSAEFAQFTDIGALPDTEAARRIVGDRLDVAIDLTLHTQHSRTALFAQRIAPVQVNYLGYPGTSGAQFMDYIIADPVLVPLGEEGHFSEAVIRLPHCYQPNDDRRPVPEDGKTRMDHGLPKAGMVLCSFNSAYKITPREFDIWMRVLGQRPGAALWLLESSHWVQDNLRREAVARGIDPGRLVFAPRMANEAHLARHVHANLFLDTFAYNAHTTGSDALWMGLPVVTLRGRQFAARVCASLLEAVAMPELIAASEAEYEALVLDLTDAPGELDKLHRRLDAGRATAALFDTKAYTRALETAFSLAHARWRDGHAPEGFSVKA